MRGLTPPRKEDLNLLCLSLVYIWNSASKSIAFMVQNDRSFPVLAFRQDFLQLIHLRSWPGHHVCHTTHERMTARYCATRVSVAGIRLVSLLNQQTCLTASWSNKLRDTTRMASIALSQTGVIGMGGARSVHSH